MESSPSWYRMKCGVTLRLNVLSACGLFSKAVICRARTDAITYLSFCRLCLRTLVRNVVKLSGPLSGATCSNPAAAIASTVLLEPVIVADAPP